MNERIQQFAEQARTSVPAGLDTVAWIAKYNEIYALLIINECAMLANEHVEECEGVNYGVGRVLKNYFGVEE